MSRIRAGIALAFVLVLGAHEPYAQEKKQELVAPWISIDASLQLRFDWTVASDRAGNRIKQLFIEHGDLEFGLHGTDWLTLRAHIAAGAVRPPLPGRNAWFRGFGMYMEELFVEAHIDEASFRIGKLNPTFAVAHNEKFLRGMGAVGLNVAYELTEMLGFGMILRPDLTRYGLGKHAFAVHLFSVDTTFLNHSIITTPGSTDTSFSRLGNRRLADGGLANTNRPDSVALALAGRGFDVLPNLGYALGFRLLRASPAGLAAGSETRDETGYSVAIDYRFATTAWGAETRVLPLAEWVHLRNPGGNPGVTNYLTLGVGLEHGPWALWLSGTLRDTTAVPGSADVRDRLFAVSLDRDLTDWLKLGIGYRYQRVNRVDDHIFGLRLWVQDYIEIALR